MGHGCYGARQHLRVSYRWKPDPPPSTPPPHFGIPFPAPRGFSFAAERGAVRGGAVRGGPHPCGRYRSRLPRPPPAPTTTGAAPPRRNAGRPRNLPLYGQMAQRAPRPPPALGTPPRPRTSLPAPHGRSGPASPPPHHSTPPPPSPASRKCRCGGVTHSPAVCSSEKSHCGESAAVSAHRTAAFSPPRHPHRTAPHHPPPHAVPHPSRHPPPSHPPPPSPPSHPGPGAAPTPRIPAPHHGCTAPHRTAPHGSGPAPLWAAAAGTELCTA